MAVPDGVSGVRECIVLDAHERAIGQLQASRCSGASAVVCIRAAIKIGLDSSERIRARLGRGSMSTISPALRSRKAHKRAGAVNATSPRPLIIGQLLNALGQKVWGRRASTPRGISSWNAATFKRKSSTCRPLLPKRLTSQMAER
jgi:hypothetical protein